MRPLRIRKSIDAVARKGEMDMHATSSLHVRHFGQEGGLNVVFGGTRMDRFPANDDIIGRGHRVAVAHNNLELPRRGFGVNLTTTRDVPEGASPLTKSVGFLGTFF